MKKTTTFTFAHLLLWLVCATLPLGFTACSDDEDPTTEQSAEPEPEPELERLLGAAHPLAVSTYSGLAS